MPPAFIALVSAGQASANDAPRSRRASLPSSLAYERSRAARRFCSLAQIVRSLFGCIRFAVPDPRCRARKSSGRLDATEWALEKGDVIGHENPESAVVLTPPPPRGFGADDATLAALAGLARAGEEVPNPSPGSAARCSVTVISAVRTRS